MTSSPLTDEATAPPWAVFAPGAFDGQVTVVTGAARGMGAETARAFADLGATVLLADRDYAGISDVAEKIQADGGQARPVAVDVADDNAVSDLYATIDADFGRVDNVITCAAVITARSALEHDRQHWQRVLDINLLGTFSVLQEGVRRMAAQGSGHVVAVASDAGKRGGGGLIADAAYAASKAGVLSVVRSLAREFSGQGVRINGLVPGPTDTSMHAGLTGELRQRIGAGLPMGRMGRPEEMAAAILYLCSPAASFVYGTGFNVDGGALFE